MPCGGGPAPSSATFCFCTCATCEQPFCRSSRPRGPRIPETSLHSVLAIRRRISAFNAVCRGPTSGCAKVILSDCPHNGVLQLTTACPGKACPREGEGGYRFSDKACPREGACKEIVSIRQMEKRTPTRGAPTRHLIVGAALVAALTRRC